MAKQELATIKFNDIDILTIKENDRVYVVMGDICNGLGIDWEGQRQRIMRHDVLSTCTCNLQVHLPGDNKLRNITTLPIEYLQGWLFTIQTGSVKPEIRQNIISFQRECFQVLHDYWVQGVAINPRKALDYIALSKEASRLRNELRAPLHPDVREHVYQQLTTVNQSIGWDTPALDTFVEENYEPNDDVAFFFEAYNLLTHSKRFNINHLSDENRIAIEPVSFRELALRELNEFPEIKDLAGPIQRSVIYPWRGSELITSCITEKPTYCWLFENSKA